MSELVAFNSRTVSPSRIGTYADCGYQFKLKYLDKVQPERNGSAALFGKVMHHARERWVMDRSLDFIELVRQAWLAETSDDAPSNGFIREYAKLSSKAIREEELIRRRRPEIKAVRMTKDWKTSAIAAEIARLLGRWIPRLEASRYDFDERDPLPALYDESLVLAWKYSEKWRYLPNAFATELSYDFEWEGFNLIGFIDEIAPLVDKDTGQVLGHAIIDAKTYRQDKHVFKDWRQCAIYKLAYRHFAEIGALPMEPHEKVYIGVDRMRLLDYHWFDLGDADVRRLKVELEQYTRAVEQRIFIPASKTCNTNYCDFAAACAFHHGNASKLLELNV